MDGIVLEGTVLKTRYATVPHRKVVFPVIFFVKGWIRYPMPSKPVKEGTCAGSY